MIVIQRRGNVSQGEAGEDEDGQRGEETTGLDEQQKKNRSPKIEGWRRDKIVQLWEINPGPNDNFKRARCDAPPPPPLSLASSRCHHGLPPRTRLLGQPDKHWRPQGQGTRARNRDRGQAQAQDRPGHGSSGDTTGLASESFTLGSGRSLVRAGDGCDGSIWQ